MCMAETDATKFPKFLSRKQVCAVIGVTYPSVWSWIKADHFPAGRKLGLGSGNRNKIVWLELEVLHWMETRPLQLPKGTTVIYGQPSEPTSIASNPPGNAVSIKPPEVRRVSKTRRRRV